MTIQQNYLFWSILTVLITSFSPLLLKAILSFHWFGILAAILLLALPVICVGFLYGYFYKSIMPKTIYVALYAATFLSMIQLLNQWTTINLPDGLHVTYHKVGTQIENYPNLDSTQERAETFNEMAQAGEVKTSLKTSDILVSNILSLLFSWLANCIIIYLSLLAGNRLYLHLAKRS